MRGNPQAAQFARLGDERKAFAFVDADNILQGQNRLLQRSGISSEQYVKFELSKLLKVANNIDRFYIYSSLTPGEEAPSWISQLRSQQNFIFRGTRLIETGSRRKQEGVDVRLTVDAMQCAFKRTMEQFVLISSDGDFLPLVEEIVDEGIPTAVVSFENPEKSDVASRMRDAADQFIRICPETYFWADQTLRPLASGNDDQNFFLAWSKYRDVNLNSRDYSVYDFRKGARMWRSNEEQEGKYLWRSFESDEIAELWIQLNGGLENYDRLQQA